MFDRLKKDVSKEVATRNPVGSLRVGDSNAELRSTVVGVTCAGIPCFTGNPFSVGSEKIRFGSVRVGSECAKAKAIGNDVG